MINLNKITKNIKINYKIILIIIGIIGAFYWWQIRPVQTKSYCAQWALIRAKAEGNGYMDQYYNDHPNTNVKEVTSYLFEKYKNDSTFRLISYDTTDYNEMYSRCLHEHGI